MSNAVAVVTESGFGKSTSYGNIPELGIEGLDPKETFLINVKGKPLPYRGWKKDWDPTPKTGNYLASTDTAQICRVLSAIDGMPHIKNVIIDDYQYILGEEFMKNALKAGFDKFNKLSKNAYDVLNTGISLREDLNFFVLTHVEEVESNFKTTYKMKTIGKMLDNKITLEGLFTIVLYGKQDYDTKTGEIKKSFVTNYDGQFPAKSPVGMFEDKYILNDLGAVAKAIHAYNYGEE